MEYLEGAISLVEISLLYAILLIRVMSSSPNLTCSSANATGEMATRTRPATKECPYLLSAESIVIEVGCSQGKANSGQVEDEYISKGIDNVE